MGACKFAKKRVESGGQYTRNNSALLEVIFIWVKSFGFFATGVILYIKLSIYSSYIGNRVGECPRNQPNR